MSWQKKLAKDCPKEDYDQMMNQIEANQEDLNMANINILFSSKYLKAEDVIAGDTVTIAGMKMEKVAEGEADKPVIYFHGKQKGLVLNETNAQMIAHITGSFDTDEWANKRVYLHSEPVSSQGMIVDSIRVGKPLTPKPI